MTNKTYYTFPGIYMKYIGYIGTARHASLRVLNVPGQARDLPKRPVLGLKHPFLYVLGGFHFVSWIFDYCESSIFHSHPKNHLSTKLAEEPFHRNAHTKSSNPVAGLKTACYKPQDAYKTTSR